ncbi:hypothetical protein CRG98_010834 [Punica granatum]|uniref:Uncharacterized protein n=1 Tax=Punica granatum TaxID=22663 RepID=A0A2I0KJT3_PUNGR|nr:hypothetical protein CRG98_010834 [Punica granatum]
MTSSSFNFGGDYATNGCTLELTERQSRRPTGAAGGPHETPVTLTADKTTLTLIGRRNRHFSAARHRNATRGSVRDHTGANRFDLKNQRQPSDSLPRREGDPNRTVVMKGSRARAPLENNLSGFS